MSVDPDLYVDLFEAILHGIIEGDLNVSHGAQLMFMAAQEATTSETFDIADELKAALSDWTADDLDGIQECYVVQIGLPCIDTDHDHGDAHHTHIAQVMRLRTRPGWHWSQVHASRTNFEETLTAVSQTKLPRKEDGTIITDLVLAAGSVPRNLREVLRKKIGVDVEEEVSSFRAELDKLFPSEGEGR